MKVLKNFLVIFAAITVLAPAIYSSESLKQVENPTKNNFFNKFEKTYKISEKQNINKQKKQNFMFLFEKVNKK